MPRGGLPFKLVARIGSLAETRGRAGMLMIPAGATRENYTPVGNARFRPGFTSGSAEC